MNEVQFLPSSSLATALPIPAPPPQEDQDRVLEEKIKNLSQEHLPVLDRLISRPATASKITVQKTQLKNIELEYEDEQFYYNQLLTELSRKEEKTKNQCLLGRLARKIYQWYGAIVTEQYRLINDSLLQKKRECETSIASLSLSLPSEEEQRIETIFKMECQWRRAYKNKNPENDFYQKKLLPFYIETKKSLITETRNLVIRAAASKGKAFQAYLQGLKLLAEECPVITVSGNTSQQVFVLPKYQVVLKESEEPRREEAFLIQSLFYLTGADHAIASFFFFRNARLDALDMQFSLKARERGYPLTGLPKALSEEIKKRLSYFELIIFHNQKHFLISAKNHLKNRTDSKNYSEMNKKEWFIKFPDDPSSQPLSLKDLQKLYIREKLPPLALIGSKGSVPMTFIEHLSNNTLFFQALNYFPNLNNSLDVYVTPDLSNRDLRIAYEHCEKLKWKYYEEDGKETILDFKTLLARHLQKPVLINSLEPLSKNLTLQMIKHEQEIASDALQVRWKIISPEIMKERTKKSIVPINDFCAAHYVSKMIRFDTLNEFGKEKALNRLTPDAQFIAVLTSEFQFLDLHAGNLGIIPHPNKYYQKFERVQFQLLPDPSYLSLKDLLIKYLNGTIHQETFVRFKDKNEMISQSIMNIPKLQAALDVKWDILLFDLDLALSESNELQFQFRKHDNRPESLIPLRSVFLESTWRNAPLHPQTIQKLRNSEERDLRVKQWTGYADAPIYQRLPQELIPSIKEMITPLLEEFSLTAYRQHNQYFTLKELRKKFSEELSRFNNHHILEFWNVLEEALSWVAVNSQDTWEGIARRYQQDAKTLRETNIQLNSLAQYPFKDGEKIKINKDLTSINEKTLARRRKIADQFFPRSSYRQHRALVERQESRKKYLDDFHMIKDSLYTGPKLISQLIDFIQTPTTPLTTSRRNELLNHIKELQKNRIANPANLLFVKQTILDECQPTFSNLTNAIYPLLANALKLNQAIYKGKAGKRIGHYKYPMDITIHIAKVNNRKNSPIYKLAKSLESQIASTQYPAFFGNWVDGLEEKKFEIDSRHNLRNESLEEKND